MRILDGRDSMLSRLTKAVDSGAFAPLQHGDPATPPANRLLATSSHLDLRPGFRV